MDSAVFEMAITEAIAMVPARLRAKIENVAFVVDDTPRGGGGRLLGLYHGVPLIKRGSPGYSGVLPDKITIYQAAIEAQASGDEDRIRHLVTEVVHHEIGHYFGMDEATVRTWEQKRRRRRPSS
ncbi:MAG: metallopeptidase family protein [Candidatus Kerfeldbacteria bacterium]|nr:metallopeptidase family protein [Candidatus Kerfeldbacteria bacterium]